MSCSLKEVQCRGWFSVVCSLFMLSMRQKEGGGGVLSKDFSFILPSNRLIKNNQELSVDTDKSSEEVFDVTYQTTYQAALPCTPPAQPTLPLPAHQYWQKVPIKHDIVYGHGHGECVVYHPAGRRDGGRWMRWVTHTIYSKRT